MAELHRKSLVLRGVLVARDVVTVLERFAMSPASARTSALSYQRHLSTRTPSTDADSQPRHERASNGVNRGARRAGRPGGPAGVPVRCLARIAGRTIPLGWFQAVGVVTPAAGCIDQLSVKRTARAGQRLPQWHSQALARRTKPTGSLTRLPVLGWSGTRGEAVAALMPPARMPMASIRGM